MKATSPDTFQSLAFASILYPIQQYKTPLGGFLST
nr:MAG TPA: hypothetical protein [Caudoviricetes sp.]